MFEQISFFDLIGDPRPATYPLRHGSQIKSKKRVKDHGEVFTAEREVKAMCDLIPDWSGNVLEPACGNGNFLVEIARRKLQIGMTPEEAASTIFELIFCRTTYRRPGEGYWSYCPGQRIF